MKFLILLSLIMVNNALFAGISSNQINLIVNSIYIIEGGAKTKYPYGIMSVKTDNPRRICENTVRNHYKRWENWGKTNDFLISLADRYCPPSADKQGNINWKRNIRARLGKDFKID